jgi:hypothetical protein
MSFSNILNFLPWALVGVDIGTLNTRKRLTGWVELY